MQITDLPFQYGDRQAAEELLEQLNALLADSDADREKGIVKKYLQKTTDVFQFTVIGTSSVGKTTLLQELFGREVVAEICPTVKICEYRYGERENEFDVDAVTVRHFLPQPVLKGIAVVDMPGMEQMTTAERQEAVQKQLQKSDVLIVVLSGADAGAGCIWDVLEGTASRRCVFVLTQAGSAVEERTQCLQKVKGYMDDAGLKAEIFFADHLAELRVHINEKLIGTDPGMEKYRENILGLRTMLRELADSFVLRKKQYEADLLVAERIDQEMDVFFADSGALSETLKKSLAQDIDSEIRAYEEEIIKKLDAEKIRERFAGGYEEFVTHLNFVNDCYRERMTDNVNKKTQDCIQEYLSGLEQVFDKATGYFRKRGSLLAFEDKFYGSLAKSRQHITVRTQGSLQETRNYYHTLSDASQELFLKLWSAREQYDKKVSKAGMIGAAAGAALGTGGIGLAATAVGSAISGMAGAGIGTGAVGAVTGLAASAASAAASTAVTAAAVILWPVVALAGAAALAKMAKKIASAKGIEEMHRCTREAQEEFRQEVARVKEQMSAQMMDTIDEIFKRERTLADQTFLDFRRSVHIDGKNIPALEEKLEHVQALMEQVMDKGRHGTGDPGDRIDKDSHGTGGPGDRIDKDSHGTGGPGDHMDKDSHGTGGLGDRINKDSHGTGAPGDHMDKDSHGTGAPGDHMERI